MRQLVRIALLASPTARDDKTIGYAVFEDMPIPTQGAVQVDGIYYNVMGFCVEVTTGSTDTPGQACIALKVVKQGNVIAAPAAALDALDTLRVVNPQ